MPCGFSYDLASDPTDNSRLFAPATGLGTTSDGIYRSTDTGATWTKVSNPAMDAFLSNSPKPSRDRGRQRRRRQRQRLRRHLQRWLACRSVSLRRRRTELGLSRSSFNDRAGARATESTPGNQCAVHMSLVADPGDPNVVYIGGDRQPANNENGSLVSQFPNSIGASTYGGRLFRVDASQTPGSQATPITNCPTRAPRLRWLGAHRERLGAPRRLARAGLRRQRRPHPDRRRRHLQAHGSQRYHGRTGCLSLATSPWSSSTTWTTTRSPTS